MIDNELATALVENGPCGINIRVDANYREVYYRIKDARNQARTEERSTTPGEVIKVSQSWNLVSNLGLQITSSVSKDLEVLAWLAESRLRLEGFPGLSEVYEATASLIERHSDELHSIDDDDIEEKLAPFAGLNGFGAEGTLIQPLRLSSLLPLGKFGEFTLWDYQLAQRSDETGLRDSLHQAAAEAGIAALSAHLAEVNTCLAAFNSFNALVTQRYGQFAPPASNIRNVLEEIIAAIRSLGGRDDATLPANQNATPSGEDGQTTQQNAAAGVMQPAVRPAEGPEGIASREDAFDLLMNVARYFRRTEPHSPISLSIETLVRRGRMDFSELLTELLPEAQTRNAILIAAGIKPAKESGN
ncbi:type VI secretion system protein TssA [Agrobacterium vitis]|uniref:type VI secretion system protein TssA n=1 Tax=Agrobacterium vitis TaxID=373 RepID=UPI0015727BFF|nr:type VI secretion system protein TssA [Agrobacterium vitis]NSZ19237.1 type VI secretion system protein TssA [Agrobacterium vitis]QZO06112.1 type VI secretion system protein TssA [Agrobacterium vitis]UJL90434.1 type VI secretion system protein TssA [Agrobacterium vitis]